MSIDHVGSAQVVQPQAQTEAPSTQATVSVGTTQFAYDTSHPIASGADGSVFFARSSTGAEVCVKQAKESGQGALASESAAMDHLGPHASIIGKLDYDETTHRLVLEKADGKLDNATTLSQASLGTRCQWIGQVQSGMAHMHENGMTHSDLNTKNVLHKDGQAMISDLGSVKDFREADQVQVVGDHAAMGFDSPQAMMQMLGDDAMVTMTKDQCIAKDKDDFLKLAYNVLMGQAGDREIPSGAEQRTTHIETLPSAQRDLARSVFFGNGTADQRIAQLGNLMAALNPPTEFVDPTLLA